MSNSKFYLIEQRGVPGARLVEADTPAKAKGHVVDGAFTVTRLEGRALIEAAKEHEVEIAGVTPPAQTGDDSTGDDDETQTTGTDITGGATGSDED